MSQVRASRCLLVAGPCQIRKFLQSIDGSLQIANLTIQPLQRNLNYYIMDAVISSRAFSASEISRINYC